VDAVAVVAVVVVADVGAAACERAVVVHAVACRGAAAVDIVVVVAADIAAVAARHRCRDRARVHRR
jgi:hypothetical protein